MFTLDENKFGPDQLQVLDLTQCGILAAKKPEGSTGSPYLRICTLNLAVPNLMPDLQLPVVTRLNFYFESVSINYENAGIVYMMREERISRDNTSITYGELFRVGYLAPHDPSDRWLDISTNQWNERDKRGGIELRVSDQDPEMLEPDTSKRIFFVFSAWHREQPGDITSPWIQNNIKPLASDTGENISKYGIMTNGQDGNPGTVEFKFEDMTGPRHEDPYWPPDNDYNDMMIKVEFIH